MYPFARPLLAAVLVLGPLLAHAVTLGDARVKSFLNQPLEVEIELVGLADGQHEDLRLRLANQDHFDRLGIAYSRSLTGLNFDVVRVGGRWLVRARSRQPIAEPFLEFPLQMTWPGGQMIRQYTFLLDPPRRVRTARATQTTRATPPAAQASTPVTAAPPAARSDTYGPVQRGETLWPIAQRLKPRGITTRQMAMALLRANPQAFINNNINMLRAGAVLDIPPLAFIEELDPQTARAQFAAQTRPQRQAAVATSPRSIPSAAPSTTPPSTEPPPAAASAATTVPAQSEQEQDQLRIITEKDSADEAGSDTEQELKDKLLVTMEEIESNRLTTDAIQDRLTRLEAEIERMQQLVKLKDEQIAALQTEVRTRDELDAAARTSEPPPPEPVGEIVVDQESAETLAAAPAPQPAVAPTPVATIEAAMPATTQRNADRPWQEQYLWLIWAALALLGLTALVLMFRRPQPVPGEVAPVELPAVAAGMQPEPVPPRADLREAEADLRAVADANLPGTTDSDQGAELPDLDIAQITGDDEVGTDEDITDSVLAEMLEESKLVPETPSESNRPEADFDDDDIASWIKELGNEGDQSEARSANDENLPDNDEIPSILTELDDQLSSSDSAEFPATPDIKLEPVDEPAPQRVIEDDTFTMSLDLARAYLEIGDQEGAKDMLQQALASTRDPEHRRQIEELLQQITT